MLITIWFFSHQFKYFKVAIRRPLRDRPLLRVRRGVPDMFLLLFFPPRVGVPAPRGRLPLFTSEVLSLPNVGIRPPVKCAGTSCTLQQLYFQFATVRVLIIIVLSLMYYNTHHNSKTDLITIFVLIKKVSCLF